MKGGNIMIEQIADWTIKDEREEVIEKHCVLDSDCYNKDCVASLKQENKALKNELEVSNGVNSEYLEKNKELQVQKLELSQTNDLYGKKIITLETELSKYVQANEDNKKYILTYKVKEDGEIKEIVIEGISKIEFIEKYSVESSKWISHKLEEM